MNKYHIMAEVVWFFHWAIVLTIAAGLFIALKRPSLLKYHFSMMVGIVVTQIVFGGCPIVYIENYFRAKYDQRAVIGGSFLCYYLNKMFGIQIAPEYVALATAAILITTAYLFFAKTQSSDTPE